MVSHLLVICKVAGAMRVAAKGGYSGGLLNQYKWARHEAGEVGQHETTRYS